MPAAYLASSVALTISTVPETFGRTSVEAQAMGCPVIVPDLGALPETIVAPEQARRRLHRLAVAAARCPCAGRLYPPGAATPGCHARGNRRPGAGHSRFRHSALSACKEQTLAVYDELLGTDLAARFKRRRVEASPADLAPEVQTTGDTTPFQQSV